MSKSEKKHTAIVVHEYGGPEVLKYEDIQRPEPKDDEILIRVIAAGVNAIDASIRSGKFAKVFGRRLPLIPGSDIAGVVEKAGSKITKFKNGDSVFAYTDLKRLVTRAAKLFSKLPRNPNSSQLFTCRITQRWTGTR